MQLSSSVVVLSLVLFLAPCRATESLLSYSRLIGPGTISAAAVDSAGNVYLTGSTESAASFPVTPGVVQPKFGGGTCTSFNDGPLNPVGFPCDDAFVVKIDARGNLIFATYLGGSGPDFGTAIAVDASGNIYVAGNTQHQNAGPNDFPTTPGAAFRDQTPLRTDGFVAKLNPSGTVLIYSTLIPGAGGQAGLAVDHNGNAYFSGTALGSLQDFPATFGAFQASGSPGHTDAVVAKLNPAGSALIYGTYLGGSGNDSSSGISIDQAGNVYIAGTTDSTDFPVTPSAFLNTKPGSIESAFVAKLNPSGSGLVYATYLGGSGNDVATGIRVDAEGNAYVLGQAGSADFPVTSGAFQTSSSAGLWSPAGAAAFLTKLNAEGTALFYSTYFSGAVTFDLDAAGNAYVAGQAAAGFPVTPGAFQRCLAGGGLDLFIAQMTSEGKLAAATYFGGSGVEGAGAIALAADGSVVVAGSTSSPDLPDFQNVTVGVSPAFAAKLRIADPARPDTPCMALALQNAASYAEGSIAPGELITLRGLGFGPETGAVTSVSGSSASAVPTDLAGVRVFFDGIPAPLLYVQSLQINAQAPWELAGKTTTQVHVEYNGASTNTASVPVAPAAPAIFRLFYSSQGAIVNQDGTVNSAANPAAPGTVIAIFGTGGGLTSPLSVTGGFAPLQSLALLTQPVSVRIGGINADVVYAGDTPTLVSGVFQINARVPQSVVLSSVEPVDIKIANAASPSFSTTVAIKHP